MDEIDETIKEQNKLPVKDTLEEQRLESYTELSHSITKLRDSLWVKQGDILTLPLRDSWSQFDDVDFVEEQELFDEIKKHLAAVQNSTVLLEKIRGGGEKGA